MRIKTLSILTVFLLTVANVFAQLGEDGYYRVRNLGTKRYVYLTDNTGSYDVSHDNGDFGAIQLWKNREDLVSDPASIVYIEKHGSQYDLQGQGTGIYMLVKRYVDIHPAGGVFRGSYTVSASESGVTKYLGDKETGSNYDDGAMGTGMNSPYQNWEILPLNVTSSDNYFGLIPNLKVDGKNFRPFIASFPFSTYSSGMKVYTISKFDAELGLAAMKELTGVIPPSTPVFVECMSEAPANNKLQITKGTFSPVNGNLLKGVYFCNNKRPNSRDAITKFDANTMRVLGKTKDGKLGFVSASDNLVSYDGVLYLPANQSYLPVPSGSSEELTVVTEAEYNEAVANRSYTITFVIDGEVIKTESLKPGATVTAPEVSEKEGHTFAGWQNLPATMPASNITVTGTYTVNTYSLTYQVDGETVSEEKVPFGTAIIPKSAPVKEGHTFSGWQGLPVTMPAKDVVVTGNFTINSYSIIYVVDGVTYKTVTAIYGSAITPIEEPKKEGHTFSGWSQMPATMPANDITVEGSFRVNSYNLTYFIDDVVYLTTNVDFGTAITAPDVEPREGYTFSGWKDLPTTMPAHDVEVRGSYNINTYVFTYIVEGEVYKTFSVSYGSEIPTVEDPVKIGYSFTGWDGMPENMPARDVQVVAGFSINSYKLSFVLKYGNVEEQYSPSGWPERFEYGQKISNYLGNPPSKVGFDFTGWDELPATMPAHDVVIYGHYKGKQYTITYYVDNEVFATQTLNHGEKIEPIAAPEKDGYSFTGWRGMPEDGIITGNLKLYAQYSKNTYSIHYYMVLGDNEPVEYKDPDTKSFGATIYNPSKPSSSLTTGYTFQEWKWSDGSQPATMPSHDISVYAIYTTNTYTITYKVDSEVVKIEEVPYGTLIVPLMEPVKEGYTFSGWQGLPETMTMPAKNITVTGKFTKNKYQLTYLLDGEVVYQEMVYYEAVITPRSNPSKTGYTFSGWSEIPTTMPAHDVTITGSFTANIYKLIYKVDNQEYQVVEVAYGTKLEPLEAPVREGYTFSGWLGIPETMPARDVVVTGSFTVNKYMVRYYVDGRLVHEDEVEYGASIPEYIFVPEDETKVFEGWEGEVYETMPAHDVEYIAIINDGIEEILANSPKGSVVYDLNGRIVTDKNYRGFVIVNGKKYLVK